MPYNSSWKIWHIDLKVMFWLQIVHASLGVELNGLDRLDGLLFTMRHEPGIFEWKHFWQLSKVFSMHAEMMQCFRLRRLAYCICLLICFCYNFCFRYFTVPFLGGFPIRGSKLNLVGEFIRGRNAQLTKLHLTRDLHCTPGVRRCACLLCCSPLSWEDLQRRPVSPEKFSFRLQHGAEVSQSALYLVGQVLVNRNAGSRILAKINAQISAGCIVKLHLCLSFSLHRKTAPAFHPSPWYALSVFDRILSWLRNTFRNTPETWLRAACILMRLQGGSMAASCQVACFQTRSTALGSKALNANHVGRVAMVLPLVWAMCFQTCHAPQAGEELRRNQFWRKQHSRCRQGLSTVHRGRKQDARRSTTKAPHYKSQKTLLLNQESMKVWISIVMGGSAVGVLSH